MPKTLLTLAKALFSLLLIWLIATHIDFGRCLASLQKLSWQFALLAMGCYVGIQTLSCLRWQIVLRASGVRVPLTTLLSNYFAGMFANIFLPGSVGGDIYRAVRTTRQISDLEVATSSVLLERFLGLVAVCILAVVCLPLSLRIIGRPDLLILFGACALTILAAVFLSINPALLKAVRVGLRIVRLEALTERFARIQAVLIQFSRQPRYLLSALATSLLVQVSMVVYLYILAMRLEIPISFLDLLLFQPISIVVTLLPVSLGGIGLQEGLWAYLFVRIGLQAEQAVALSVTFTVLGWLLSLPGGLFVLRDTLTFRVQRSAPSAHTPEGIQTPGEPGNETTVSEAGRQ